MVVETLRHVKDLCLQSFIRLYTLQQSKARIVAACIIVVVVFVTVVMAILIGDTYTVDCQTADVCCLSLFSFKAPIPKQEPFANIIAQ